MIVDFGDGWTRHLEETTYHKLQLNGQEKKRWYLDSSKELQRDTSWRSVNPQDNSRSFVGQRSSWKIQARKLCRGIPPLVPNSSKPLNYMTFDTDDVVDCRGWETNHNHTIRLSSSSVSVTVERKACNSTCFSGIAEWRSQNFFFTGVKNKLFIIFLKI